MSRRTKGFADRTVAAATVSLALLLAPPAAAEHPNHARGFRPESVFDVGGIDNVNLFNGNLTLTIPIGGSFPVGPELSYGLTLTYTGNVWEWENTNDPDTNLPYLQALPRNRSNAGLGWALTLGRMLPPEDPANTVQGPVYESPDQAIHEVNSNQLHADDDGTNTGIGYSRDSTYLRSRGDGVQLEEPDGTIRTFGDYGPTRIEDRYGNGLTIEYPSANVQTVGGVSTALRWKMTDDYNREQVVDFQVLGDHAVVSKVTLTKSPGADANEYVFSYSYTPFSIPRACNDSNYCRDLGHHCGDMANADFPLLTKVQLPDGSFYSMPLTSYHLSETSGCPNPQKMLNGQLEKMRLPTGGYLRWTWGVWTFPSGSEKLAGRFAGNDPGYNNPYRHSVGVTQRCQLARNGDELGCWSYVQDVIQAPDPGVTRDVASRTTVTDPAGDDTVHYFNVYLDDGDTMTTEPAGWIDGEYGLPFTRQTSDGQGRYLTREVYDGTKGSSERLRRSVYVSYDEEIGNLRQGTSSVRHAFNPRVREERTRYHDDLSNGAPRDAVVERSDFDGLGHYRTVVEKGSFPFPSTRTTTTDFNPGRSTTNIPGPNEPWVLGTYDQQAVTESSASGTETATQEFCFDSDTGFLEQTRMWEGTARGAHDVVVTYRDGTSQGTRTDGFVRHERYYGGDGATLGTGGLCNLSLSSPAYGQEHTYTCGVLATSEWTGTTFSTTDRTIHCATGLVAASRDTSGLATSYTYDALGRLTRVTPPAGLAQTNYL